MAKSTEIEACRRMAEIEALDPTVDMVAINTMFLEDFQKVLAAQTATGNMFTFAAPRMSRILASTGEFTDRTPKRVVDTVLLTQTVMAHGFAPGEGRSAAKRVNAMHRHYDIHPDDFIAVGSDIAVAMIDFAERFGWRKVTATEKIAVAHFHGRVARVFGSHQELPDTIEGMRAFWEQYCTDEVRFEPQNKVLAGAFLGYLPQLFPRGTGRFLSRLLVAQVDPRVLAACGVRRPSKPMRFLSDRFLGLLGRSRPKPGGAANLDRLVSKVYPDGWTIETIGSHIDAHSRTKPSGPTPAP